MITNTLMNTYNRLPLSFTRGSGAWLWDEQDNAYLDALAGIAVCGLGHAHPTLSQVIAEQATTLLHTSNIYRIPHQEQLAQKLTRLSQMDTVFFGNSGAEANEAAIKIARLYGHKKGMDTPSIVVMDGSFHGRTLATLTASGNRKIQAGFEPLVQGFIRIPYNDLAALRQVAEHSPQIVAVLVEPIQGESGIQVPDDDYLAKIRAICDEKQWLMMLDEIQTGLCRTGQWFAYQQSPQARPDVMTLAKALGNGIPISACLASGPAAEIFQSGNHGSTYGGNPFACRVASTVIDILEKENLQTQAAQLGKYIRHEFRQQLASINGITDIRGKGLMIGIELDRPCTELVKMSADNGLLINVTANKVIRLLPPLILTKEEANQIVQRLTKTIKAFFAQ